MCREPRPSPAEERAQELLREALGSVEPPENEAAEDLFDDVRVDIGKQQELAVLGESTPSVAIM
jgi:hypothetical protein